MIIKLNTLHLLIIIACIAVMSFVGLAFTMSKQSTSDTTNTQDRSESTIFAEDCTVAYPATTMPIYQWLELGGKQVNASKALLVGRPIPIPKYFPAGYYVKKFAVSKDRVTILASKFPINSSLTNIDFMYKDRGISIYFDHVPQDQKTNELRQPANQTEWKLIDINKEKGLGHEVIRSADPQDHGCSPAELIFYIGNDTRIGLTGLMPLTELAKIATSF